MKKLILFLIIFSCKIYADSTFLKYGLGFGVPQQKSISQVKLISVGNQYESKIFDYKFEAGGWADNTHYHGVKNSGFISMSLGVEPKIETIFIHWFTGVAAITDTDVLLGSWYQFCHDFGVGLHDKRKVKFGFHYKHFSNAGIRMPNRGRDFFGVILQIPLK